MNNNGQLLRNIFMLICSLIYRGNCVMTLPSNHFFPMQTLTYVHKFGHAHIDINS